MDRRRSVLPAPFYWSTGGYGIMFHTFAPGRYDFGAAKPGTVALSHATPISICL